MRFKLDHEHESSRLNSRVGRLIENLEWRIGRPPVDLNAGRGADVALPLNQLSTIASVAFIAQITITIHCPASARPLLLE